MNRLELSNFNPDLTLLGGQGLSWEYDRANNVYYGATSKNIIELKKSSKEILWQTYPTRNDYDFVKKYFRLDTSYDSVIDKISVDQLTKSSIAGLPGLRLISQPFMDTVIMFISSTNRNIPLIKQSVHSLCTGVGQKIETDTGTRFLFPTVEQISDLSVDTLLSYKFGYRAPFIKNAAKMLMKYIEFSNGTEDVIRSQLLRLPGVGPKVADCIMSFSLGFDNVIPQDVWMRRIFNERYGVSLKTKYAEVVNWYRNYWGEYAAWAGQFLFEFLRKPR